MPRLWRWTRLSRARSLAGLGCLALLLTAINILAAAYLPDRLDLTAGRLYTLSPATRQTLSQIDEPITLRFYYSPRLAEAAPADAAYARRVRRLLDDYVAAAHGKVRLEIEQPQPFSEAEDQAVAFGLRGVPLNDLSEQAYFGLAGTNSVDEQQVIPFFARARERLLEYDLTRLVQALAAPAAEADLAELHDRGLPVRRLELLDRLQHTAIERDAARQRALEAKLAQAQARLRDLTEGAAGDAKTALSSDEARAVTQLRADIVATRRELRGMPAAMRRDTERVQAILATVDIALAPILVAAAAIIVGAWRRRHRAAAPA